MKFYRKVPGPAVTSSKCGKEGKKGWKQAGGGVDPPVCPSARLSVASKVVVLVFWKMRFNCPLVAVVTSSCRHTHFSHDTQTEEKNDSLYPNFSLEHQS